MEEDFLHSSISISRFIYLPGGYDKNGNILVVINLVALTEHPNDFLPNYVEYLKKTFCPSNDILPPDELQFKGFSIVCTSPSKIHKPKIRQILNLFSSIKLTQSLKRSPVTLYLVKSEGFWEKHMEQCTKSQVKNEAIIMTSKSRLTKFFNTVELPEELNGTLGYSYDVWLNCRLTIDEYKNKFYRILKDCDESNDVFCNLKQLKSTETQQNLSQFYQKYSKIQSHLESMIEIGTKALQTISESFQSVQSQDIKIENKRISFMVLVLEQRSMNLKASYLKCELFLVKLNELKKVEERISEVINWITGIADHELTKKKIIGCDESSCEDLKKDQDIFELECRETYGLYGELNYKIEKLENFLKEPDVLKNVLSQKQFMDFLCRSFANRLERRRNILISGYKFFRQVSKYYEKTSLVLEAIMLIGNTNNLMETATTSLEMLKDHEHYLALVEKDIMKEGEKLTDILSIPFKDSLGRDLSIDCSIDIANIREILDAIKERREIFLDSLELQKLTLEQITHINSYESDAKTAMHWMDDLYNVMIKYHSHVGCNIHEIQVQKKDLQTFEETGKSIFDYGKQLLEASKALRISCKLSTDETFEMLATIDKTWRSLQTVSQENMTRLRVSAVFHRSVDEYCNKLYDLKTTVNIFSENRDPSAYSNCNLRLRKYLALRECLLVEVGRMVRLGKLLKTRLKEPFTFTNYISEEEDKIIHPTGNNSMACEAISNKLSEIAVVAENLDGALQGIERRMESVLRKSPCSEDGDDNNNSRDTEDELSFITAVSDCTYAPPTQSSSFHTASEFIRQANDLEEHRVEGVSNNASYDSSDRSYYSAHQSVSDLSPQQANHDYNEQEYEKENDTPSQTIISTDQRRQCEPDNDVASLEHRVSNNENVGTRGTRKTWSDRNYENFVAKQTVKGFL